MNEPINLNRNEKAVEQTGLLSLRFYSLLEALVRRINSASGASPLFSSTEISFSDSPYTVTSDSETLFVDATGGNISITLASAQLGRYANIIKVDSTSNTVTVGSSDLIIGSATQVLNAQYDSIECIASASEYYIR